MNNLKYTDNLLTKLIKLVITIVFAWSCVFWSSVTVIYYYALSDDSTQSHFATGFLIGTVLILISLILIYNRLYIVQLPFCLAGSIIYLNTASKMIDLAIEHKSIYQPPLEIRYLPEIAFLLLSIVLAMIHFASIQSRKITERNKFDNSPSKSILDD